MSLCAEKPDGCAIDFLAADGGLSSDSLVYSDKNQTASGTGWVGMRRLILLAVVAATALSAGAARRVNVAQLEQSLASDLAAHRADADIARKIGDFELSERLTSVTLDRFAKALAIGPRTALALELLSDQSALLDPPATELPATQPPDAASQQRMMDQARGYVVQTWPRLPNFFLTRTTHRFDDGAQVLKQGDWPVRAGLHPAGSASRQITFRDGKEVQDTPAAVEASAPARSASATASPPAPTQQEVGLHTWGEFGPELTVVLTDTAKGTVTFSHWETTPAGVAAVFRYSVPKAASHYTVSYCCVVSRDFVERREMTYRSRTQSGQQMANLPKTEMEQPFVDTPGYHGSLFIDPASGAILRVTLEAELKESDPITRAATVVEYGPVRIGDQTYICPVRSLAISSQPPTYNANGEPRNPSVLMVNETSFTQYHRLGSTMRLLAGNPGPDGLPPPADAQLGADSANAASTTPASSTPAATAPASAEGQPSPAAQLASAIPPPAPGNAVPESPAVTSEPATASIPSSPPPTPEITLSAANGVPDQPADMPQPSNTDVVLKVTSRLVDVGVVVYDKKGHPVRDLKQEDFEVYDNGRKQQVRFFSQFSAETAPAAPGAPQPAAPAYSNRAPDPAVAASPGSTQDAVTTILIIDESHIAWADMSNARQQLLKFLNGTAPGERIGLYIMTERGFKVLKEITTDHAAIIARLQSWMPKAQSISFAQEEETRNRQQINEVHNVADLNSVNGNHTDVADADQPIDPQLLTMGDNPGRAALIILGGVARHLSALPGHKNLIWLSSDNVFAEWRDQAVGIDKSSKQIDTFALHAQEAMNDAHVAVYPFDVSQLETAAISADIQHRNVELNQAAQDSAALASSGAAAGGRGSSAPAGGGRDMTPGRVSAEMSQDLHPIQGPIREVAEGTGGRTIRRSGDMAAEMASVVAEGHAGYRISFHPDTNADNQYHSITVKLTGKHGMTPRYRTGYYYDKEPANMKERFQQAVWRPMDANEVAVTADVGLMNPGANVKINVATGDLGMQQRLGRWADRVDIFFIQRDDIGVHAQVEGQRMGLLLKPETYTNLLPTGVPFEHVVHLKPGTASLRVLVVDENSGRMGSVTIPAEALGGQQ